MVQRPVFLPEADHGLVGEAMVEFEWFPGFAVIQKQRSIASLHAAAVDTLGLRFGTSHALTEWLACFTEGRSDFGKRIRTAHETVATANAEAVAQCLNGDAEAGVRALVAFAEETLNARTIETAHELLERHGEAIASAEALRRTVQTMRTRYRTSQPPPALGEQAHTGRAAGGLSLPTGYRPRRANGPRMSTSMVAPNTAPASA